MSKLMLVAGTAAWALIGAAGMAHAADAAAPAANSSTEIETLIVTAQKRAEAETRAVRDLHAPGSVGEHPDGHVQLAAEPELVILFGDAIQSDGVRKLVDIAEHLLHVELGVLVLRQAGGGFEQRKMIVALDERTKILEGGGRRKAERHVSL